MTKRHRFDFDSFISEETAQEQIDEATELANANIMWEHINSGKGYGIVSAFSMTKDAHTNKERHHQLEEELSRTGFDYIRFNLFRGGSGEDDESVRQINALFIPGITKNKLLEIGHSYGQKNVFFGSRLGTASCLVADGSIEQSLSAGTMMMAWCSFLYAPCVLRGMDTTYYLPAK